ncbi:hypothetical protein GOBAR_DD29410 [Gossypium barbadense]|nr:hypothetical protein GOBAR_DD29410 [Gossypium barbadense]
MHSLNGRNLNKKRSNAQFHLELGQSDFLLHACQLTKRSGTFQPALADRESIQARSELFAYNILSLDHGGIQQAIMKFPEV